MGVGIGEQEMKNWYQNKVDKEKQEGAMSYF